MNTSENSTIDETCSTDRHNKAMLMRDSEQGFDSPTNSRHKESIQNSVESSGRTVKSTSALLYIRDRKTKPFTDNDEDNNNWNDHNRTELKVKGSKSLEELTIDNLDESNIWSPLTILETTFTKTDDTTNKDNREIIENLTEQFNYSPRSFVETLLTIIEESVVELDATQGSFRKTWNTAEVKLLEDESVPKSFVSLPGDESKSMSYLPENEDSTKYLSLKRTRMESLFLNAEMGEAISEQRSRETTPECSPTKTKSYRKTPNIARVHRLRLGCASSIGRTPRKVKKTFTEPPKITIDPASPQPPKSHRKGDHRPLKSCEEDEYLTAESDTEHSKECTESCEPGEPVAISAEKANLSKLALHHKEWVQTFQKVSLYKPLSYGKTVKVAEGKGKVAVSHYRNKLERRLIKELHDKREKCFDAIQQILQKYECNVVEDKPASSSMTRESKEAFLNSLHICSEYLDYGMKARNTYSSWGKVRKISRTSEIRISAKNSPSAKFRTTGPLKVSVKTVKRRSLKGLQSPRIDKSSIRKVAELRAIFSPGQQAIGGSQLRKRHFGSAKSGQTSTHGKPKKLTSKFTVMSGNLEAPISPKDENFISPRSKLKKFKHVVSPVAQYIRGKNLSPST